MTSTRKPGASQPFVDADLPQRVRVLENTFIPLSDGGRLAARIWLPEEAEQQPVPLVLEYLPYRKRDMTRARDEVNHRYLAAHGYATARVDMRGSGDSDGVLTDEYEPTEQHDALEVIDWLTDQPWCDGNVGMMGISWGGFNALQVAARRPPALRAIISLSASDDLYHDNMHWMGGCLLTDNLSEATVMFAFNSLPPDPEIVGDRWRDMWQERLEGSGLWLLRWLEHQRRDDYWKRASVCEDYAAIQCPVMAVGGWADGYTNAVLRLLAHLDVPRRGLIGPWGHTYPHLGVPGPAVGFLQEAVRWWDHWLKGVDQGVMEDPVLRIWMQDSVPPDTSYEERPGRWVSTSAWPPRDTHQQVLGLTSQGLVPVGDLTSEARASLPVRSPLSVGLYAGKWASYAAPPDLPYDQREEDGGSLVFETSPLTQPLEVLGRPEVRLQVSADQPDAMLALRLSDVAPDGEATRITYGLLNLTHRDGHEQPEPLEPGERYDVRVTLNGLGQLLPPGHRLRLSISTSYWPLAWPSPRPATVTVHTAASQLELPVRDVPVGDDALGRPLDVAEGAPALDVHQVEAGDQQWRVERDLVDHESTLHVVKDKGVYRLEDVGTQITDRTDEWYRVIGNDPTSARAETQTLRRLQRDDWDVEIRTRTVLSCTEEAFVVTATLDAYEMDATLGNPRIHARSWTREIPRDHV